LLLTASLATGEDRVEKNVVYGTYSGLALLMDVYYPETPKGIAVVVIPGSGWQATMGYGGGLLKDHPLHDELVDPVVSAGFTAFVLSHRQAPTFQYPAAVEDVQRAVRYVRYHAEDFGVNPDSIGVVGHSSGGHLAAMLGVLDGSGSVDDGDPVNRVKARVQAVVTVAAPTDLAQFGGGFGTPYVDTFVGAVHLDAGGEPHPKGSVEWQLFHDASPISWVSTGDAPMLLFHGDQDAVVPVRQAEAMAAALQAADVTAEFVRIPEGGHVWAEDWVSFPKAMVLWFDRFLKE
jgi:acetyl esterase/lipase